MPIEGVSNIIRLPRIGKIHLGEKVEDGDKKYCRALPYLVCPVVGQPGGGLIQEYYKTDKPTELDIIFPSEDMEIIASQYLKVYHDSHGLVCIGDGLRSKRKIDIHTGGIADRNTTDWEWRGRLDAIPGDPDFLSCNRQECPEFLAKECKKVLCLQFMLPLVKGIGVWQLDTTSFYSTVNVNSMLNTLREAAKFCGGRGISWVPLKLRLGPMEVFPQGMKKKKVNVLHIVREEIALVDLLKPAKALALPGGVVLQPSQAQGFEVDMPDDQEAPPDFAKDGFIDTEQAARESPQPTVVVEGAQPTLQEEWAKLRKIQSDFNREHRARMTVKLGSNPNVTIEDVITDGMIKGKLKQLCPKAKFTSAKFNDVPPDGLTLAAVRQCREALETYVKKISTPVEIPTAKMQTATEVPAASEKLPASPESAAEAPEEAHATTEPPEDIGALWDEIRNLVKECKIEQKGLQTWWSQYGLTVTLSEFDFTEVPEKFSYDQLRNFHQNLIQIRAHKRPKAKVKTSPMM